MGFILLCMNQSPEKDNAPQTEGGVVVGASHEDGGVDFVVVDNGKQVELEGRELVISRSAFDDNETYTYTGTNYEILNQINQKYGGNAMWEKVDSIGENDFVICIISAEDPTVRTFTGTNEQVVSAINGTGGCVHTVKGAKVKETLEGRKKMKAGGSVNAKHETYKKWRSLVNMSAGQLQRFYDSEEGRKAGLRPDEANEMGIGYGRQSARWIIRMKQIPYSEWSETMWEWANRQISFISRMVGNKGGLYDENGNKTRKHLSLLIWGHDPMKKETGGEILIGGKADGMTAESLARLHHVNVNLIRYQLRLGKESEIKDHTKSGKAALEIAKDHVYKDPYYYTKESKIENDDIFAVGGSVGVQKRLRQVYRANDCTDLNDVEYALTELRKIAKEQGAYTPAMRKRLVALENKKKELQKPVSMHVISKAQHDCNCMLKMRSGGNVGTSPNRKIANNITPYRQGGRLDESDKSIREHLKNFLKIYADYYELTEIDQSPETKSFIEEVWNILDDDSVKANKVSIDKLAAKHGITSPTIIKELVELVIVMRSRVAVEVNMNGEPEQLERTYKVLVEEYEKQPLLTHRTSMSIMLQQYSTAPPLAYLMGYWVTEKNPKGLFLEPSAGNGMLTIASGNRNIKRWDVNEIDDIRNRNLRYQDFRRVLEYDGSIHLNKPEFQSEYEGIATNPPFGSIEVEPIDGYGIKSLEHVMAIRALRKMSKDGRAAIIIGGHIQYDEKGRLQGGKNREFFSYLYEKYNVIDIINIESKKLYYRMGTGFDVRIILIDGIRPSEKSKYAPLVKKPYQDSKEILSPVPVATFDDLLVRFKKSLLITEKK